MSGWGTVKAIRALEARIDALGFEFAESGYDCGNGSRVALKAKGDCLPHYNRDAELWVGTLEELQHWLNGLEWARQYDYMLKIADDKKRSKAESAERNRQLMSTIKKGKLVQGSRRGLEPEYDVAVDDEEVPF